MLSFFAVLDHAGVLAAFYERCGAERERGRDRDKDLQRNAAAGCRKLDSTVSERCCGRSPPIYLVPVRPVCSGSAASHLWRACVCSGWWLGAVAAVAELVGLSAVGGAGLALGAALLLADDCAAAAQLAVALPPPPLPPTAAAWTDGGGGGGAWAGSAVGPWQCVAVPSGAVASAGGSSTGVGHCGALAGPAAGWADPLAARAPAAAAACVAAGGTDWTGANLAGFWHVVPAAAAATGAEAVAAFAAVSGGGCVTAYHPGPGPALAGFGSPAATGGFL